MRCVGPKEGRVILFQKTMEVC